MRGRAARRGREEWVNIESYNRIRDADGAGLGALAVHIAGPSLGRRR
jgi:hypothetical protein